MDFLSRACPVCKNPAVLCPLGTWEPSEFQTYIYCYCHSVEGGRETRGEAGVITQDRGWVWISRMEGMGEKKLRMDRLGGEIQNH